MPIPDYQSIMLPLLQFASDGAEHRSRDGITALAQHFNLTPEEVAMLLPSGQDYLFGNRWGWARTYLKKAGLIAYPSRGKFQITSEGRALLKEQPAKIDVAVLKRYPDFLEFWNGPVKDGAGQATVISTESPVVEQTPEELIASAHDKLRKQIQSELLSKVMSCSPAYFERLVVRLLTVMGYGGSLADAGSALGRSGDGGIDGEIKEDKLGLDRIYIQAKRWGSTTVGSPEVRDFIGALAGKKARKGVLITTSKFSRDAIASASNLEKNVILVDGDRLSELMFEYGLGVTTESTYHVKRIENDFFDEDEV
jgi:restriction system protein